MLVNKTRKKNIYNNYDLVFYHNILPHEILSELKPRNKHNCLFSLSALTLK